jgi:hypothetical protein
MRLALALALTVALVGLARPAAAMNYAILTLEDGRCHGNCRQAIVARGEIFEDEPQRLLTFVAGLPAGSGVPLDFLIESPGGSLGGALRLGAGLRRLGMRTIVGGVGLNRDGTALLRTGNCASACVFVLMGGTSRLVPSGSRIAIHAPRRAGVMQRDILGGGSIDPQVSGSSVNAIMMNYARDMGVDPALILLANGVPHDRALVLSEAEISRYRLASRGPAAQRRRR